MNLQQQGVWYVKAMVNGNEFLTALESQPVAFNVTQPDGAPENSNHDSNHDSGNQDMVNNVKQVMKPQLVY